MFEYHLFSIDEDFDLLHGSLPQALDDGFRDQLTRARAVWGERDAAQLTDTFDALDWLLSVANEHHWTEVMERTGRGERVRSSRVKALKAAMPHVDTGEPADRILADWAVDFAALALAYIGEVVYEYRHKDQYAGMGVPVVGAAESIGQRDYGWRAQAIECMDAVAYAEQLASEAQLRADVATSAAQQLGKRGGEVRTKDYRVLRLKALKLYTSKYRNRSNREAARLILERELSAADIDVFNTDDPRHRIEIWIGNHKRGALKS